MNVEPVKFDWGSPHGLLQTQEKVKISNFNELNQDKTQIDPDNKAKLITITSQNIFQRLAGKIFNTNFNSKTYYILNEKTGIYTKAQKTLKNAEFQGKEYTKWKDIETVRDTRKNNIHKLLVKNLETVFKQLEATSRANHEREDDPCTQQIEHIKSLSTAKTDESQIDDDSHVYTMNQVEPGESLEQPIPKFDHLNDATIVETLMKSKTVYDKAINPHGTESEV